MKVAIFHSFLDSIGGAEKLVLTLARALGADVVTTDHDPGAVEKLGFRDVRVISLGRTVKVPPLKQITASRLFASCDFSGRYDAFILSGDWAVFAARRHGPNLYYCHTPPRFFYDLYESKVAGQPPAKRPVYRLWVNLHRHYERKCVDRVGRLVANSENTRARIRRFYGREADVVHPFADCGRFRFESCEDFWLSVGRFYPEKRLEVQMDLFRSLPGEKLIVIGGYASGDRADRYRRSVEDLRPENVEIRGTVSEAELLDLYARCKGHIATARDEDFGMTVVEAMAAGKPVVAVDEGGFRETVVDGVTGRLVPCTVQALAQAVRDVGRRLRDNPDSYREPCMRRAREFDVDVFVGRMKEITREVLEGR